jgi:hypothetical protein
MTSTTATLETRALEFRAETDTEAREVRGIAVPWGELADIAGVYREQFTRGSLEAHPAGVKLYDQHRQLVGTAELRDAKTGAELVGKVAKTGAGNDFLELVRSGALGHLSIGFDPREHSIEEEPADGGTPIVTRTRAIVGEVSGVPFPAYAGASITDVRAAAVADRGKEQHMTEDTSGGVTYATADDMDELREELLNVGRRMDTFSSTSSTSSSPSRFRTAGDFLKALAAGDEAARSELRAADGTGPATSAQAIPDAGSPGWMQRPLKFVQERRRIVNLFSRDSLPAQGNTVEYPKVESSSGTVGQQAAEGDALGYMEVQLDTGSATVGTYGGYSSLTRQTIERGNPAYLSAVLNFQAIQYAKATNARARADFLAMVPTHAALVLTGGHAAAKAADWIDVIVDGAGAIEDESLGLLADFIVVGRDVFKSIASLSDLQDRPIFALPNGGQAVNVAGSAAPVTAQFNIAGLPGFVDPALAPNTCRIASSEALTVLESPGAPFRLEDESIINLTKDFSLYGYLATTENDAAGVVTVDVDGI